VLLTSDLWLYTVNKFSLRSDQGHWAAGRLSYVRRGDHTPAAPVAAADDERVSTAAWLLAADHLRSRRCRQLLQLHPAACTAASSIEMDPSVRLVLNLANVAQFGYQNISVKPPKTMESAWTVSGYVCYCAVLRWSSERWEYWSVFRKSCK